MTLFSIFCVLVFEQFRALPAARLMAWQLAYAGFLARQFDAGHYRHGLTAWSVGVAGPVAILFALHWALGQVHALLAFLLAVVVLYFTVGFRQFSHFFTDIQLALRSADIDRARALLGEWRGQSAARLASPDVARLAIEQGIVQAHRHVFAPIFWFVILGPAGALLYRLSLGTLQDSPWALDEQTVGDSQFGVFFSRAFMLLDWLPARLTAATFAVVGDFEDAVFCWRTQAPQWPDQASGILLASGAGALGARLGMPVPDALGIEARPELGVGDDVDVEHMQSAIGLIWRALVLCLLLLALLTVVSWTGG